MKKQINLYDKKFEKIEKLGEGTYGIVYKVKLKSESTDKNAKEKYYALKKFKANNLIEGMDITALREITILKEISHENIVKIEDLFYGISSLYIAYEYLDLELKDLIYNDKNVFLTESAIKNLLYQILNGLSELRRYGVLHRDMKPQNLLLTLDGVLKIVDFGFARFIASPGRKMTKGVVSNWYRAPEIFFGANYYSYAVDIWSTGCIFAEMINKRPLFGESDATDIKVLTNIFSLLGVPDDYSWPDCKQLDGFKFFHPGDVITIKRKFSSFTKEGVDLLEKMLTLDPNKRISVDDALKHPFFSVYPPMASNNDISELAKKLKGLE